MPTPAPLQLLVFRHADDLEVNPYHEAILRAFQGGVEARNYLATGEDLGIQIEIFDSSPALGATAVLDSFCHTVTVVLVDNTFLDKGDAGLWNWLADCWNHTRASSGRHAMLVLALDERVGKRFLAKRSNLGSLQLLKVHTLGEQAIRPAMFALRLLHECRVRLADALNPFLGFDAAHLKLFISHAKMDGLPLAQALRHQIAALSWLPKFYDADDLPPGCDWQAELEKNVGASLIVMLRTEEYDNRYWCQLEVLWADEYATPAVLVDARTNLSHPAGVLPLDRVPSVRIPDGNLVRILFLALREGLRFLYFMRRVEEMKRSGALPNPVELRVFTFQPSMAALLRACRALASSTASTTVPRVILYPDPPFRAGTYEAAQALVESYGAGARLVTPNTLAATKGATP
jgi:TIR domain